MTGELAGQTAIVTGAGRGFGRAIALGLAAAGASIAAVDCSRNDLAETVSQIESARGQALPVIADVTVREDVARAVDSAQERFGPISLLVSNAGITGPHGPIWNLDPDEWWGTLMVHLRGAVLFMNAVLPCMVECRLGRIIIVSSNAGKWAMPYLSGYGVAKASQIRLVELAATELREHGLSIFAIEPGTVVTRMAEETISSLEAQRWLPQMVEYLQKLKKEQDPTPVFARCVDMCVDLASGRYDALTGRFLIPENNFSKLLQEVSQSYSL